MEVEDYQVLGHQSNQGPSPSVAQFGHEAGSRESPGCFKLLPLTETTCFCEISMLQNFFLYPCPDQCLDTIPSRRFTTDN